MEHNDNQIITEELQSDQVTISVQPCTDISSSFSENGQSSECTSEEILVQMNDLDIAPSHEITMSEVQLESEQSSDSTSTEENPAQVLQSKENVLSCETKENLEEDPLLVVISSNTENDLSQLASSNDTVEDKQTIDLVNCENFDKPTFKRISILEQKIDNCVEITSKTLVQDFECVKKMLDEVLSKQINLTQEIATKAESLKTTIRSVLQLEENSQSHVLDHLEACFNVGQWLEKNVKPKRLIDCKELLKDYIAVNYGGISKVKDVIQCSSSRPLSTNLTPVSLSEPVANCDPFLVTVTSVTDPGEFFVVRLCDQELRNKIFSTLKENASSYSVPADIVPGQMYAVQNSGLNWYRGVCGKESGIVQVGDKPGEALYEFFLLDQGHHEHIAISCIRLLPPDVLNYPPIARECTLNSNFQRTQWSAQATANFKQMTWRSPMNMKVFSQEGGILNVDLAQLPCFGEEAHIVSVRDALFFSHRPITVKPSQPAPISKKFKPRIPSSILEGLQVPKHFAVHITWAISPSNVYVQIHDEEDPSYQTINQELQEEYNNLEMLPSLAVQYPRKGDAYAVKYKNEWFRALLEDFDQRNPNRLKVFYVDTGHRQTVNLSECFKLVDKYMETPVQAMRCVLDGVYPIKNRNEHGFKRHPPTQWNRDVSDRIRECCGRNAVVFVEQWTMGGVGRFDGTKELTASVVLYLDGEKNCLNLSLSRYGVTRSVKMHERQEHVAIRSAFAAQQINALRHKTSGVESFQGNTLSISTNSITSGVQVISDEASALLSAPLTPEGHFSLPENSIRFKIPRSRLDSDSSSNNVNISSETYVEELTGFKPFGLPNLPMENKDSFLCTATSKSTENQLKPLTLEKAPSIRTPLSDIKRNPAVNDALNVTPLFAQRHTSFLDEVSTDTQPSGVSFDVSASVIPNPWSIYKYTFGNEQDNVFNQSSMKSQTNSHQFTEYLQKSAFNDESSHHCEKLAISTDDATLSSNEELTCLGAFSSQKGKRKENNVPKADVDRNEGLFATNGCEDDIVAAQGAQLDGETGIDVIFSWCDNPHGIYVRTCEMRDQLRELRNRMQKHYKNAKLNKAINFDVGFVCAVYTDTKWYRVEVVGMDNYPECDVYLIDTGYQRKIHANDIYQLEPEFEEFPRLTMQCSLFGLNPPYNGNWEESVSKYIGERLLGSERIIVIKKDQSQPNRGEIPVTMLYVYNEKGGPLTIGGKTRINLNDELVTLNLASRGISPLPRFPAPSVRAWKPSALPKYGSVFWGIVTWVNLQGEIYLHDIKANPTVSEISKWLNEAYNDTEPTEADLRCSPGDICIAKYRLDKCWHRAIVKNTNEEPGLVTVFFVDYGTLDSVSIRDIRLNTMLEELPVQAIRCKLDNIQPVAGSQPEGTREWKVETLDHLHTLIVEKEFRVRVKGRGLPLPVGLANSSMRTPLAELLVQKRMAEYIVKPVKKKKVNKNKRKNKNKTGTETQK